MFVLMNSNTQTEACKLCAQISMLFLEMILQTSILGLFLIKGGGELLSFSREYGP